jgi:hypothetical protein
MKIIQSFNHTIILALLLSVVCFAQFTTDRDTLVILTDDSTSYYYEDGDTTAGYDLNGKILVGVDFDTTSAFTAAKFFIQTSATYNSAADTSGGTPYDWKTVSYLGDTVTFVPEVNGINFLNKDITYALKRYISFGCLDAGNAWETEAGPRKLIPLIRSGF